MAEEQDRLKKEFKAQADNFFSKEKEKKKTKKKNKSSDVTSDGKSSKYESDDDILLVKKDKNANLSDSEASDK